MDLQKWCEEHGALGRSMDLYFDAINEYMVEHPRECKKVFRYHGEEPIPVFDKVYHVLTLPDFDREYVYLDINIEYCENTVGWYRVVFDTDGNVADEVLVLE